MIKKPNFSWGINISYSHNENRILKIDGQTDANGNQIDQPSNGWFIGHSINAYYQYVFDGIFNNTNEIAASAQPTATVGSIRVKDINGDGVITTADKKIIDASPKWIGSFSTTFNYKGLELFLDFYTVQGVIKNNSFLYDYNNGGSNYGANNGIKVDYWTPSGQGQEAPLPSGTPDTYLKSLGLQDASYIRLRTISLGYTFQKVDWMEKAGISKFNIYSSLGNFFTWTKYKAFGPETSPSSYPEPKTVNMGINVSF